MFSGDQEFVRIGLSSGEAVEIADVAAAALTEQGHALERRTNDLDLCGTGYLLMPRLLNVEEKDDGGFQTSSIVRFTHPDLFPDGAFEYQHATGDTLTESLKSGFSQWARMDFPTLLDTLSDAPRASSFMEMAWPAPDGRGELKRRLVLGPTGHLAQRPDAVTEGEEPEHPFCPCCLTTNCLDAFQEYLQSDRTYGLRLYAARMANGEVSADCRINGEEFEAGKAALRKYAATWPDRGLELRKQYVVIRSI